VLSQNYPNLEYIIIDGGSEDGCVEIIKKYEQHLKLWVSEPDKGMYDAINKGFGSSTGDVLCWLNSDDLFLPDTLKKVGRIFATSSEVEWLYGASNTLDERTGMEKEDSLYLFDQCELAVGLHGLTAEHFPQPCSFWCRELWDRAGGIPEGLRLAGDYWLWKAFAKYSVPFPVSERFAIFRIHATQLSTNICGYREEALRFVESSKARIIVSAFLRRMGKRLRFQKYITPFCDRFASPRTYYNLTEVGIEAVRTKKRYLDI
jgi:glycosyltransferase involved in cell wall biosynthesis